MSEIKPLLRQMIDNNKSHWRPETIRGAHKMLDEYEAKAKAFEEIIHAINISSQPRQSGRRYIDKFEFTKKAEKIIEKYESGECDAEK